MENDIKVIETKIIKPEVILLRKMEQILSLEMYKNCKIFTNSLYNRVKFTNFIDYEGHFLELEYLDTHIKVLEHSLPDRSTERLEFDGDNSENSIFTPSNTPNGYLIQFMKLLENFELFYKYIGVIDELCYVVEPTEITTKHNWRIFKLNEKVFIKIVVNQFCPNSVLVNLYGPTKEVELYRQMYNENAPKWNIELDIYNNLLKIFDLMYFPIKDKDEVINEDEIYCNICYSYVLNGHIPICSCDNAKCDLIFHLVCLKEWFSRSTDGKTFLTVTMGSCPFCKEVSSYLQIIITYSKYC